MIRVQIPTTRMIPAIRMILKNLYPPRRRSWINRIHHLTPEVPEAQAALAVQTDGAFSALPDTATADAASGSLDRGNDVTGTSDEKTVIPELAGLVGISTSAVSNLEKGKPMVTVYTLGRIAEALGIGMGEMFQGSPGTGRDDPLYSRFISLYESLEGYDDLQKERILSDLTMLLKDLPLRL